MRKLTAAEIDRFDFTGQIPALNVASPRRQDIAPAKKPQRQLYLNMRPAKKRRLQMA